MWPGATRGPLDNNQTHILSDGLPFVIHNAEDRRTAIELWRKAVAAQDALHHDEPPAWYYSIRESLGAALLRDGQAADAEKVFRADLARNPRSLFGMWQSLLAQNKTSDAGWVKQQFDAAWQHADAPLRLEDL